MRALSFFTKTVNLPALVALVALAGGVFFAPAALAHDELQGSVPAADSIVQTSPDQIELTFNNDVMTMGAEFAVKPETGATKDNVIEGAAEYHGKQVTQKLKSNLPEGSYNAAWRVVSSDGHPIGGNVRFSIGHVSATQTTAATDANVTSLVGTSPWMAVVLAVFAVGAVAAMLAKTRRQQKMLDDKDEKNL